MKPYPLIFFLALVLPNISSSRHQKAPSPAKGLNWCMAEINGSEYYEFISYSGSGSITDCSASVVTVTVYASGPPNQPASTSITITGALFSNGTNTLSVSTPGGQTDYNTATFTMPSSGSVSWTGTGENDDGSNTIQVQ